MSTVLLANAVYPPEPVVSAQMGRNLAECLAGQGHQVTVLCPCPSRPYGAVFQGTADSEQKTEDGSRKSEVGDRRTEGGGRLNVVHLPSYTAPQSRLLPRMWESFSFGWHVCRYLKQNLVDVDVVYANVWPLFSQALIARYCSRRGIPLVLHIQDVYPESLKNKMSRMWYWILGRPLLHIDRWTMRQAERVVVISESMREIYLKVRGLAEGKVVTVLNWVDETRYAIVTNRHDACARYGMPDNKFTFLYLGNIGPVAGIDVLMQAFCAAALKRAQLIIAGSGSARAKCEEIARACGSTDIRFLSVPDVDDVASIQSMADVCLLPMKKGSGESSIPSKLPYYMMSAKPILATVDECSDTARFIREAECGWVGEPENVDWLADKMREVALIEQGKLDALGANGRGYAVVHFSKRCGVVKLAEVITSATGQARS